MIIYIVYIISYEIRIQQFDKTLSFLAYIFYVSVKTFSDSKESQC